MRQALLRKQALIFMRDACALAVNGSPFWDAEIPEGLVVANKPTRGASHARLLGTAHNVMINNNCA